MKDRNLEALSIAEEILRNIELGELPLSNVVLKCARLARLTNNQRAIDLFKFELAGYPKDVSGYVIASAFELARFANRTYFKNDKDNQSKEYMFLETVAELESTKEAASEQLKVAYDRDVSVSSSNPYQTVMPPMGNSVERHNLREKITSTSKKIDQLKIAYYQYVLSIYYELEFGNINEDIFTHKRKLVDNALSEKCPDAIQQFMSSYENLRSSSSEDWSNAVHSCRRILMSLADSLFPASENEIIIEGKPKKLTQERYIMRLKEYIKTKSTSDKYSAVVGSHLDFIGDRIDSLYDAANKGTHAHVTKKEAEMYVIYTYLLIGDILTIA